MRATTNRNFPGRMRLHIKRVSLTLAWLITIIVGVRFYFILDIHGNHYAERDGRYQQPVMDQSTSHDTTTNNGSLMDYYCKIRSKDAWSAIQRATTTECKSQLAKIACRNEEGTLYPQRLPMLCPFKELISKNVSLVKDEVEVSGLRPIRIVFVLTVTGRAVRQIRRLLRAIYHTNHYYFIHVDNRQAFLYNELLKLENDLPNVRLARERYAPIWGGTSLLKAHLSCMKALLDMTDWRWDYYINLSESDYPIKNIAGLSKFLQKYQGYSFLKLSGRKQDQPAAAKHTFYECDDHLWRVGERQLPVGLRYDMGSDWVCLHRKHCVYAVDTNKPLVSGLLQVYEYSILPVESFFHVLLRNSEFCEEWFDHNLHLVNWRTGAGCSCHRKIADWCGCSPLDMKQQDFAMILNQTETPLFFARKFECIVDQAILDSIDSHLELAHSGISNLRYYWQNDFHALDSRDSKRDIVTMFADSFMRRSLLWLSPYKSNIITKIKLIETNVLYVAGQFDRYLVKFAASLSHSNRHYTLETQLSRLNYFSVLDPSGIISRLKNLEVGTDFDRKELIFRNYAGFIGPDSIVSLRHTWGSGIGGIVTFVWVDPSGYSAQRKNVRIPNGISIEHTFMKKRMPLRPGVWTVRVLNNFDRVSAEVRFLVLPSTTSNITVSPNRDKRLNPFKTDITTQKDFREVGLGHIPRNSEDLLDKIDRLTEQFWKLEGVCSSADLTSICQRISLCSTTNWSSLSPDPKSEFP